jgi:transcriptional regulator with XRE-family HTH domain
MRGLTQVQLANASGVKQSDVSKIERGETLRPTGLIALAHVLDVSPHWLATGDGAMHTSHTTSNIKFSVAADEQAPIAQALQALDAHLKALAPVLQDSGREVLRKWATGAATVEEVANALEAMALASNTLTQKKSTTN